MSLVTELQLQSQKRNGKFKLSLCKQLRKCAYNIDEYLLLAL